MNKPPSRRFRWAMVSVVALAALLGLSAASSSLSGKARPRVTRLSEATLIVEVNDTEGDAGLQFFLDADPWDSMVISDPTGRIVLDIDTRGRLNGWGMTELFSESNEPPFDEVPLKRFKKRFPEGTYTFRGTDIEGRRLVGRATLSHDIPDGPQILTPADGSTVAHTNVLASWASPPEPPGIHIVGYRAIVEREDPLRVFSVELPASVTSVTIPSEFLESGTEYKLEVQAIEDSGNWTFSETTFRVS
jgi:hypothetical protein